MPFNEFTPPRKIVVDSHGRRTTTGCYDQQTPSEGDTEMPRFMVIVKATKDSEAGKMPSQKLIADMTRFNEELVKAGVMEAGEGLQPSSKGVRVKFAGDKRIVTDGPFAETKELIAGFWLWKCKSRQEAIDWVKRSPNPTGTDQECEIEIRQILSPDDFGPALTPELREKEAQMRATVERQKKSH
jgi:hypothetical protein